MRAMSFDIAIGLTSAQGPRDRNDDCAAVMRPSGADEPLGWIAALADGVAGREADGNGRMAALTTVNCLVRDYFATPHHWDTTVALDRLIRAQNAWLADHNRRKAGAAPALTTLSAIVLRGHSWTVAHVGDSRVWLLRDGQCQQLTEDHALDRADFARLTRALGLDDTVRVDYGQGELRAGDRLVLTSDGVHGALSRKRLAALALEHADAQAAAQALVDAALAGGGRDNATALVLQVNALAEVRYDDVLGAVERLPAPPRLAVGDRLDGLTVEAQIADGGVHRIYRVRNADGAAFALKALVDARNADAQERAMLAHEGWLGQRFAAVEGCVRAHERSDASAFYLLFDWHDGRTLEQLLDQRPALPEFLAAATAIARALGRLHRAGVVHRDIKPANLHRGDDGQWRLLDLGVALSGREPAALRELHAGTPSYINPEQWDEPAAPADAGSDLFALGVTLYQWLTGHLPYGEIEPYQRARYRRDPVAPSRRRPEVPIWLDHLLQKAVNRDASLRFETAEELLLALERGASRPLPAPGATPLARRNPVVLWQFAFVVSAIFNALLIYWILFLPK